MDRAADHDALPQGSDHSARFVEHAGQKCGDEIDQRVELPADPGFGERPAREEALDGLDQPPFAEMLDVPLHGVRTSGDRGARWHEVHAAGPFDLRRAPASRFGPFIGDYMGLVGLRNGFGAVFVMARPQSRNGPTDVFFSKIPG